MFGEHMTLHRSFDPKKRVLRFRVPVGGGHVTAYISETTWRARFGPLNADSSLLEFYLRNQTSIDTMVVRKVDRGAHKSVVLMAIDFEGWTSQASLSGEDSRSHAL